jgi:hypothetical protein
MNRSTAHVSTGFTMKNMRSIMTLPIAEEVEVVVRWIELVLVIEAAVTLVLSSSNCAYFGRLVTAGRPPRRVGAFALVLVNAAFASEAAVYLALGMEASSWRLLASVLLRGLLLCATGFLSLLVWRQTSRSRP